MKENIDSVISCNPDVVIAEFGMNDQVVDGAGVDEYKELFRLNISDIIDMLQEKEIDVVLVVFCQNLL